MLNDLYQTFDVSDRQITDWLRELAQEFPSTVKLINVGKSYEGRDLLGVHVSYSPENQNKSVLLEGGIHAREWYISIIPINVLNNQTHFHYQPLERLGRTTY